MWDSHLLGAFSMPGCPNIRWAGSGDDDTAPWLESLLQDPSLTGLLEPLVVADQAVELSEPQQRTVLPTVPSELPLPLPSHIQQPSQVSMLPAVLQITLLASAMSSMQRCCLCYRDCTQLQLLANPVTNSSRCAGAGTCPSTPAAFRHQ